MKKLVTLGVVRSRRNEWLLLEPHHFDRHMFIAGGTGGGKTSLLLQIMRQKAANGEGFSYYSPANDGRLRLLEYLAANGYPPEKVVDLCPDTNCAIHLCPWANMPAGLNRMQEESWLRGTNEWLVSAVLGNVTLADQEIMNLMVCWLKNVFYCCGKRIDGEYLGMGKALMLLNPDDDEFEPAMDRLWPELPPEIRSDVHGLRSIKSPHQRQALVRSTINRLRRVFFDCPLMLQMFSKGPSLDCEDIIRMAKILLVCPPEEGFPRESWNTLMRIVASNMLATSWRIPEKERVRHTFIMDEFENMICEPLRMAFQEQRKYKTPLIPVVQDMSSLTKGDMELGPKVVSQCAIQATFKQQEPDTLDYLGKSYAYFCLRLKPIRSLQQLQTGHDVIQLQGVSFSATEAVSASEAKSMTKTHSVTRQEHDGETTSQSVARALSRSRSDGGSEGESEGTNWSIGHSDSRNETLSSSRALGKSRGRSVSDARSLQKTESTTEGESEQATRSESEAASMSSTSSSGNSSARNESHTQSASHTRGLARSEALHGDHNRGENRSDNRGNTNGHSTGNSTSQTNSTGESRGNTKTQGASSSRGHSKSVSAGRSEGETHTEGITEGESETQTDGRSVGRNGGV